MKRLVALLLALGILVLATPIRADKEDKDKKAEKKEDKDKKDKSEDKEKSEEKLSPVQVKELEKLSGTFSIILFERDGKKSSADDLKTMKVVQKGADWTFSLGEDSTTGKDKVYPDKNPKQIDSLYTNGRETGKTVFGIYEIDGDTIKYCWAEPAQERPKEFASKPDSKLTYMILKRIKEEKPAEKKDKEEKKDKAEKKDKEEKKDKAEKKDKDVKDK